VTSSRRLFFIRKIAPHEKNNSLFEVGFSFSVILKFGGFVALLRIWQASFFTR
jgi:hypothetical protein